MPHFKCVSKRNEIYKDFIQKTKKKQLLGLKWKNWIGLWVRLK